MWWIALLLILQEPWEDYRIEVQRARTVRIAAVTGSPAKPVLGASGDVEVETIDGVFTATIVGTVGNLLSVTLPKDVPAYKTAAFEIYATCYEPARVKFQTQEGNLTLPRVTLVRIGNCQP